MYNEKPVYLKIETGFVFKPDKNDVYVEPFSNQSFNQNEKVIANIKTKYCNPPNLIFQALPLKAKFGKF